VIVLFLGRDFQFGRTPLCLDNFRELQLARINPSPSRGNSTISSMTMDNPYLNIVRSVVLGILCGLTIYGGAKCIFYLYRLGKILAEFLIQAGSVINSLSDWITRTGNSLLCLVYDTQKLLIEYENSDGVMGAEEGMARLKTLYEGHPMYVCQKG
jgi:hypothetical protein